MELDGGRVYRDSKSVLVISFPNSVYDAFVDGIEKGFMIREKLNLWGGVGRERCGWRKVRLKAYKLHKPNSVPHSPGTESSAGLISDDHNHHPKNRMNQRKPELENTINLELHSYKITF